jgi:creatinine amidohydrolase
VAVFVAGHYPLIDLARAAILEFMDSRKFEDRKTMVAWAFADFLLMEDYYSNPGDHGACWETSHLMFLHPDTVDLSLLEEHDKDLIGILITNHSPREASAVFGQETIEKTTHEVLREVKKRLTNPGYYRNHGRALMEK